jgi:hypothetical protein
MLVFGMLLGAGALFTINLLNPAASPGGLANQETATPASLTEPASTASPQAADQTEPAATTDASSTATLPPEASPSDTPQVTANASRCATPSEKQVAAILAGIWNIQADNDIPNAYLVKSIAADELWFLAARVHGPDIEAGSTSQPAVWSFYEKNGTPYNIYTINDVAFQYSDFNYGPQADPPIDMDVDGANSAYECALNGQ